MGPETGSWLDLGGGAGRTNALSLKGLAVSRHLFVMVTYRVSVGTWGVSETRLIPVIMGKMKHYVYA